MMNLKDRFRGCLIGGAAGDALGYAVEFLSESRIFSTYGPSGITEYELTQGEALFSDDTQMTLFTAAGLLGSPAIASSGQVDSTCAECIRRNYIDWMRTQQERHPLSDPRHSWLAGIPGLFHRRAPGNTCLNSLNAGGTGTPERRINNSKGCGGVMRVAPVGLWFVGQDADPYAAARLGAEAAALTHGHSLGWMPAAALAQIVYEIVQNDLSIREAVRRSLDAVKALWPADPYTEAFLRLMHEAMELADGAMDDLKAIHLLGEGWVGDEALAIAAFCAIRYPDDIDRALIASVNHNGDSDSTGAIAGNIVGAKVGLFGIPDKYTEHLELIDLITEVADDLFRMRDAANRDSEWELKYAIAASQRTVN